ncbi:holin [Streptomyces sp. ITFR-6]|uniref:holin n=1 Tax=Streptomyces sp. ITFR-6 TaxID=3075197 RepID=UPI00288BF59F|nr:holin [Streptomyces sp. ITFR-6]WNI31498.1 holin [Streptomyces sp. ITFR-6]
MAAHTRVENKVSWAAAAAYIASTGLLGSLAIIQDDARLLSWMPDAAAPFALALVPAAITFVAGWQAKHTPRAVPAAIADLDGDE